MPKKLCCCKEDLVPEIINPNWIAIPCKEYANHVYKKTITQSQFLWPNQTSSTTTIPNFNPLMWDAGITYPWYFADTPNYVSFDKERPVFVMQRGGGGGGKTGDSISSAVKGGNAAYVEVIIPADKYWATIIASGGSGPSALDIRTSIPNYSGAQGYPLSGWGGGANLLYYLFGIAVEYARRSASGSIALETANPIPTNQSLNESYIAAGGGGGGVNENSSGGHGGTVEGIKGNGDYGGAGGKQTAGGTVLSLSPNSFEPQPGSQLKGGRGRIFDPLTPITPYADAGGGGAAGLYGGGGGNLGDAGGGGSSKLQSGRQYVFSGSTYGPGSRCNPFFGLTHDAGLGANRNGRFIKDCEVWEDCPNSGITFSTGDSGSNGETATLFRTKWCTCTENQTTGKELVEPNYICLTEDQYLAIIAQQPTVDPPPPAQGDVELSFVLNGERYILLYECNLSCESQYIVEGTPTDVKWYVQGANLAWFADYPEWNQDNVTTCCDCYECIPICPSLKVYGSPTPNRVKSCAYANALSCYWHLDPVTQWFYQCKPTNCWANYGIQQAVNPYDHRIMDPNTVFDCTEDPCEEPPEKVWYALKCDDYFENECCPDLVCCGPNRIEFCENYLRKLIGEAEPDLSNFCYFFLYLNCVYVLTGFELRECDPSASTPDLPINQGTFIERKDAAGQPCCRPTDAPVIPPTEPPVVPPGTEGVPLINTEVIPYGGPYEDGCESIVVKCYPFKDQFGLVQPIEISSSINTCVLKSGIDASTRSDGEVPGLDYTTITRSIVDYFKFCNPDGETPGTAARNCSSFSVGTLRPGYYNFPRYFLPKDTLNIEYKPCEETTIFYSQTACKTCVGGQPGTNPFACSDYEGIEFVNQLESYEFKTAYRVTPSDGTDRYIDDALQIFVPKCVYEQENGFRYLGRSEIDINTGWGSQYADRAMVLRFSCSGKIHRILVFSGNAAHIAEAINSMFNPIVSATGLNPYFWFNCRQSCFQCGSNNEPPCSGPNTRPPFLYDGNDIITDSSLSFNETTQQYVYTLKASSRRFTVCASQQARCIFDQGEGGPFNAGNIDLICPEVINHCNSLNSLSMPEYAQGFRYIMSDQQLGCGNQSLVEDFGFCISPPNVSNNVVIEPAILNNPSCMNVSVLPDGIEGRKSNPRFLYFPYPFNGYQKCYPPCGQPGPFYPYNEFCFTEQYPTAFSACDFTAPWPTVEIPNYTTCINPTTGLPNFVTRFIKYYTDQLRCTTSATTIIID
jgi:hypothetical protein